MQFRFQNSHTSLSPSVNSCNSSESTRGKVQYQKVNKISGDTNIDGPELVLNEVDSLEDKVSDNIDPFFNSLSIACLAYSNIMNIIIRR